MRINQNIAAFNAYNNLNNTQNRLSGSLEKLSSGFRINRAADDASGLVNSENLRSQIGGLKVATRNAQDAISLVQTAEGAQTEVHSILQRMRDLVVQSGNTGVNDAAALKANNDEISQLKEELDRIAGETQFGTQNILDGSLDIETTPGAETQAATAAELAAAGDTATDFTTQTVTIEVDGVEFTGTIDGNQTDTAGVITALQGLENSEDEALSTVLDITADGDSLVFTTQSTGDDATVAVTAGATELGFTGDTSATGSDAEFAADTESGGAAFQVGANAGQTVTVGIGSVAAAELGQAEGGGAVEYELDGATRTSDFENVSQINLSAADADDLKQEVADALATIDQSIADVSDNRAELGAFQNRMESTVRNISVAVENLSAAESRIRDTDMALEMVEFTRNQILSQAGTAMLAQANVVPQSVLSLLG